MAYRSDHLPGGETAIAPLLGSIHSPLRSRWASHSAVYKCRWRLIGATRVLVADDCFYDSEAWTNRRYEADLFKLTSQVGPFWVT
jgi:hypothetical protein